MNTVCPPNRVRRIVSWLLLLSLAALLSGCDGCRREAREKYFNSLEKVGLEKRELLVKRVNKAKGSQEDAQEQFEDALEQFQSLVAYDGGDLEKMYNKLKGEYDASEVRAEEVRERIRKVENVAQALFDEWQEEIQQFDNASYRRDSEVKLRETQQRYSELVKTMKKASTSMDPVLIKLRDQVLFLKHNLNAKALGSLDNEAAVLETDITRLIGDMQTSIAEAEAFISEMTAEPEGSSES